MFRRRFRKPITFVRLSEEEVEALFNFLPIPLRVDPVDTKSKVQVDDVNECIYVNGERISFGVLELLSVMPPLKVDFYANGVSMYTESFNIQTSHRLMN